MRVLIACEYSGVVREAFKNLGHDAWSCDILPTDIHGKHIQHDVIDVIYCKEKDISFKELADLNLKTENKKIKENEFFNDNFFNQLEINQNENNILYKNREEIIEENKQIWNNILKK